MFHLGKYLSSSLILIADCPWPKQEPKEQCQKQLPRNSADSLNIENEK